MKKNIKVWIGCLIAMSCSSSMIKTYHVTLSFDSLFPMTWYQKGLESSLFVWQTLINFFDKGGDQLLLSFDVLLARLAFAQFCINRMHQENNMGRVEDNAYFVKIVNKVQKLLGMIIITPKNHDFILCAEDLLQTMRKQLSVVLVK